MKAILALILSHFALLLPVQAVHNVIVILLDDLGWRPKGDNRHLALYFLGGEVLNGIAFALFTGVVVGTYSSIFVASPVLIWLNEKSVAMQKKSASRTGRSSSTPT